MKFLFAVCVIVTFMTETIYYRHRHLDELDKYSPVTKLISGIGLIIALAGIICNQYEEPIGKIIFLFGMMVSFVVCLPAMNKEGEAYYVLLQEKKYSRKQLWLIHPLRIWIGHAMGGAGFISRMLMCFTIIGRQPVKFLERPRDAADYIAEQQELRLEAEELEKKMELYEISRGINRK